MTQICLVVEILHGLQEGRRVAGEREEEREANAQ